MLQPQKEMLARSSEQGCLAGGDAAGFNSRNTSHLSYCKIDVCLDAENALDPFFPPLAGMKSRHEKPEAKQNAADFEAILGACR